MESAINEDFELLESGNIQNGAADRLERRLLCSTLRRQLIRRPFHLLGCLILSLCIIVVLAIVIFLLLRDSSNRVEQTVHSLSEVMTQIESTPATQYSKIKCRTPDCHVKQVDYASLSDFGKCKQCFPGLRLSRVYYDESTQSYGIEFYGPTLKNMSVLDQRSLVHGNLIGSWSQVKISFYTFVLQWKDVVVNKDE